DVLLQAWRCGGCFLDLGQLRRRDHERSTRVGSRASQIRSALSRRDSDAHLGMVDEVLELGAAPLGIDGNDRDPQRIERQPMEEKGGSVFEHQAGAMAMSKAGGP